MGFLLLRDGWQRMANNRQSCGVFILDINVSGHRYCFATHPLELKEFKDGPVINCISAILNSPEYSLSVDPYSRQFNVSQIQFSIMAKYFPVARLIRSGQIFGGTSAKVYWAVDGNDSELDKAFFLISGVMDAFVYDEPGDTVSFAIIDNQLAGDRTFPPHSITNSTFDPTVVPSESFGKPYPIVIGTVTKMPVIDISADETRFLVMDDPFTRITGTPVALIYDGDEDSTVLVGSQASGVDAENNSYWYVDASGDPPLSKDITVDVTGIPGDLTTAIIYLLSAYSSKVDFFDLTSLHKLYSGLQTITLSMVFNSIVGGGVIEAIRSRLIKEFPLVIIQYGEKLYFQNLVWDRDVVKVLSTDKNIIQTVSNPTEVNRSEMSNSFIVNAGVSGLRGDFLSSVSRNKDNDAMCLTSFRRYGELSGIEINLPDIADAEGATWLINWSVQTYSQKRVRVSYLCSLETIDLKLWDTVQVFDLYHDWVHGPLFKVVGIHYGTSNGLVLDLLSVDDYFDVHGVNQNNPEIQDVRYLLSQVSP
jgi:hypothetical protein